LFATKCLGEAVRYNDTIEVNKRVCKVPFAKMSLINSTNDVTFNPVLKSSRLVIFSIRPFNPSIRLSRPRDALPIMPPEALGRLECNGIAEAVYKGFNWLDGVLGDWRRHFQQCYLLSFVE
jgi:hypothetical protein